MNLQKLFSPKLSRREKDNYLSTMLVKKKQAFKKEGLEGIEYKNKVFLAKTELELESEKGIIRKYYKPIAQHKKIFQSHIIEHNLSHLFHTSEIAHFKLPPSIKTDIQFTNHISKQNLFSIVFPEFERFDQGSWQACIFTKQNVGWITKDDQGYYRYCTKSKETGVIFGFSLLDIMEIAFTNEFAGTKMDYQVARKMLATTLRVNYRDFDYVVKQKEKYQNNLAVIQGFGDWKALYPNLFSIIKSQLYILDELQNFASKNIMEKRHAIDKEAVFFLSTRQIAKHFDNNHHIKRDPSTFASAINLFATVCLLRKIPSETLQSKEELLQIATEIRGENNHYNLINFMTIPFYNEELLRKAEKTAKRLRKNKITTAKQITSDSLIRTLGEKKTKEIIHVREVSLMGMSADQLYALAQRELGEVPWEEFDVPDGSFEETVYDEEPQYTCTSSIFTLTADELYELALQHEEAKKNEDDEFGS